MGYARHIGRVGALAVTLGVGVAVATTPGVAFAQTDTDTVSADDTTTTATDAPDTATESPDAEALADEDPADEDPADEDPVDEDLVDGDEEEVDGDGADEVVDEDVVDPKDLGSDDKTTATDDDPSLDDLDADADADDTDDADALFRANVLNAGNDADADADIADQDSDDAGKYSFLGSAADDLLSNFANFANINAATAAPATPTRAVGVVSELVSSLLSFGTGGTSFPLGNTLLFSLLAFARNEFGTLTGNYMRSVQQQNNENVMYVDEADLAATMALLAADPTRHVLMIGVDGTNLSAILDDPYNTAFFDLMEGGTTGAATLTGHTTISNPSWTSMLTGVQSETAGVDNNVFTPWTYDTYPTIYQQLETYETPGNPIHTTSIADWVVQSQLAGGGGEITGADNVIYIAKTNDSWEDTDDQVGLYSIQAIEDTAYGEASYQFTYFVGVDNTGHETYGGSPQYVAALRNVNDNIGVYEAPAVAGDPTTIMQAVYEWENSAANMNNEYFTVLVVTDHGQSDRLHYGQLAHGFQTPIETTTFVIADDQGHEFTEGGINNTYRNVDITPTIMELFDIPPLPYSEGTPLMDKQPNTYKPVDPGLDALKLGLNDAIDMYGYPDIATNLALSVRTIAVTIPYVFYGLTLGWVESSPAFLQTPVTLFSAAVYNQVNMPAQIIARATGVTGNSIIPPEWNPYTTKPDAAPPIV